MCRPEQLLASGDRSAGKFHRLLYFTVDNGRQNGPLISVSERATLCTFISAAVGWWGGQVHGAGNQISSKIHQPHQRDKSNSSVRQSCCIIKGCEVSRLFIFQRSLSEAACFRCPISQIKKKAPGYGSGCRPLRGWIIVRCPCCTAPRGLCFNSNPPE